MNEPEAKKIDKTWIQSLEGRQVFPRSLQVDQVGSINELAHALAGKNRFTCQTRQRYSVAQHCVIGSHLLPSAFAGAFLLHELSEVYLPDIAGPLKPFVRVQLSEGGLVSWEELERQHTTTILKALGLSSLEPLVYSPEVKRVDLEMLAAEKRDLCGTEPAPWGLPHGCDHIAPISPVADYVAEQTFLDRFNALFK